MKILLVEDEAALRAVLLSSLRQAGYLVEEAADFAQSSPEPDPAELYTDVMLEG